MAKWHFAGAEGMPGFGLNDAGMESFRGAPLISLAREICQNSTDALPGALKERVRAGENVDPVTIDFSVIEGAFPDASGLLAEMTEMSTYYKQIQKHDTKVLSFLDKAMKGLRQERIKFLRISDYGTTGLCGIDEIGTPWDNLIMSDGNSDKDITDGGSKGIGHSAAFVNTDLQVVFYQTRNIDGKTGAAGVARLVSRRKLDKSRFGWAGIGFFGEGGAGMDSLPVIPRTIDAKERTATGTDVYIAGFSKQNWEPQIVCSAVDSFLLGFFKNRLLLNVAGQKVSCKNLGMIIEKYEKSRGAFPHHANQYYKVLTSSDTRTFRKAVTDAGRRGNLHLRLLLGMDLDVRKVALIRDNGMLIFEKDHISGTIPFAGVLEIEGAELNGFLRGLENPQHTEWSADRAPVEQYDEVQNFLSEIWSFCKQSLFAMMNISPGQKIDSGLGSIDNPGDTSDGNSEEDDVNDEFITIGKKHSKSEITPKPGKKKGKKKVRVNKDEEDEVGRPDRKPEGGTNVGGGSGGLGKTEIHDVPVKYVDVDVEEMCSACVDKVHSEYEIQFTPGSAHENGKVRLYAIAETDNYEATVVSARLKDGITLPIQNGNEICGLSFVKNTPVNLLVTLDYSDYCSLEMEAYGSN